MRANERELTAILQGLTQYLIPVFQRDYSWSEANCQQLWQDVLRVGSDGNQEARHFIGSVVYVSTDDAGAALSRQLLIDGQQRLTSIVLLATAIRDFVKAVPEAERDEAWPTIDDVEDTFLKNRRKTGDQAHKLILRRHDQETLRDLVEGADPGSSESRKVRASYDFFMTCIASQNVVAAYRGLARLIVIDVRLKKEDNPQRIFESMNSTGVDLSQSDLIRNFLLMQLREADQTRLYDRCWQNVENPFRGQDRIFDAFTRDFVALRTQAPKQPRADDIYREFRAAYKQLLEPHSGKLEPLLEEMVRFAGYYAAFHGLAPTSEPLMQAMARLRAMVVVPALLVMRLYDCHSRAKTLSEEEFVQAIDLLDSYVLRRAVCGMETRGYWQIFADMSYALEEKAPLESLKALLAAQESYRFPSDTEFGRDLQERDLYHLKVCWNILARLETHKSKEVTNLEELQIEHVLPQNEKVPAAWRQMLGKKWQADHQTWVHRLGNLTLTGYNQEMSDASFQDKKTMDKGLNASAVNLNRDFRGLRTWTARHIDSRGKRLTQRALGIWSQLVADPKKVEAIKAARLKRRSQRQNLSSLKMRPAVAALYEALAPKVVSLGAGIVGLVEDASVAFHGPEFFLEVLPRNNRLILLLPIEFSEVEGATEMVEDARQWRFIVGSSHDGGTVVTISEEAEIDQALPYILQGLIRSRQGA